MCERKKRLIRLVKERNDKRFTQRGKSEKGVMTRSAEKEENEEEEKVKEVHLVGGRTIAMIVQADF